MVPPSWVYFEDQVSYLWLLIHRTSVWLSSWVSRNHGVRCTDGVFDTTVLGRYFWVLIGFSQHIGSIIKSVRSHILVSFLVRIDIEEPRFKKYWINFQRTRWSTNYSKCERINDFWRNLILASFRFYKSKWWKCMLSSLLIYIFLVESVCIQNAMQLSKCPLSARTGEYKYAGEYKYIWATRIKYCRVPVHVHETCCERAKTFPFFWISKSKNLTVC